MQNKKKSIYISVPVTILTILVLGFLAILLFNRHSFNQVIDVKRQDIDQKLTKFANMAKASINPKDVYTLQHKYFYYLQSPYDEKEPLISETENSAAFKRIDQALYRIGEQLDITPYLITKTFEKKVESGFIFLVDPGRVIQEELNQGLYQGLSVGSRVVHFSYPLEDSYPMMDKAWTTKKLQVEPKLVYDPAVEAYSKSSYIPIEYNNKVVGLIGIDLQDKQINAALMPLRKALVTNLTILGILLIGLIGAISYSIRRRLKPISEILTRMENADYLVKDKNGNEKLVTFEVPDLFGRVKDDFTRIAEQLKDTLKIYASLFLTGISENQKILAEKLTKMTVEEALEPEQKKLFVGFCDIVGFTDLCDQWKDPKKITAVLNIFCHIIQKAIKKHEGIPIDFNGDEVIFYLEDNETAAQRGVKICLEIKKAMKELPNICKNEGIDVPFLPIKVSLHYGECIIGWIGKGEGTKKTYTIISHVMNEAARIMGHAREEDPEGNKLSCILISSEVVSLLPQDLLDDTSISINFFDNVTCKGVSGTKEVFKVC